MVPPDFSSLGAELLDATVQTVAMVSYPRPSESDSRTRSESRRCQCDAASCALLAREGDRCGRAVPELILAVVFVAAVGLGPVAGTCALAIGSVGFLGKLVADAVEEIDPGSLDAVTSWAEVGGTESSVLFCHNLFLRLSDPACIYSTSISARQPSWASLAPAVWDFGCLSRFAL